MRVKLMWLGLSLVLFLCVYGIPVGESNVGGTIGNRIAQTTHTMSAEGVLVSLLSLIALSFGSLIFGMRCLLGRIAMETRWAIAIGLPCTAFGVGVLFLMGLSLLGILFIAVHGMPGP